MTFRSADDTIYRVVEYKVVAQYDRGYWVYYYGDEGGYHLYSVSGVTTRDLFFAVPV